MRNTSLGRSSMWLAVSVAVAAVGACRPGTVRDTPLPDVPDIPGLTSSQEGILGPLDVVDIRVFDEPDISGEYRVDVDGSLQSPFADPVEAAGMTPQQLGTELQVRLGQGYLVSPVVTVFVKEAHSRKVFVLGRVKRPGPYPFVDGMTIVEAIALAGGVESDGQLNRTRITRRSNGEEINLTVQVSSIAIGRMPNVKLHPDDIVFVPKSPI